MSGEFTCGILELMWCGDAAAAALIVEILLVWTWAKSPPRPLLLELVGVGVCSLRPVKCLLRIFTAEYLAR